MAEKLPLSTFPCSLSVVLGRNSKFRRIFETSVLHPLVTRRSVHPSSRLYLASLRHNVIREQTRLASPVASDSDLDRITNSILRTAISCFDIVHLPEIFETNIYLRISVGSVLGRVGQC